MPVPGGFGDRRQIVLRLPAPSTCRACRCWGRASSRRRFQAVKIVGGQLKIDAIEIRVRAALLAVEPFHPAVKVRMLAPVRCSVPKDEASKAGRHRPPPSWPTRAFAGASRPRRLARAGHRRQGAVRQKRARPKGRRRKESGTDLVLHQRIRSRSGTVRRMSGPSGPEQRFHPHPGLTPLTCLAARATAQYR
ncbi:hypothetical protein BHMPCIPO_06368 [Ensifer sesbaniae]|nr:hypothetical protein [Ensifer sesbaniae]